MALFQLSEGDERSFIKRLFLYIHSSSVSDTGFIEHRFDSTWTQICRFLLYFDPQGKEPVGYQATKSPSQILAEIDARIGMMLPPIEAFLDVALSINNHRNGLGAKTLYDPMTFEPELRSILVSLELLAKDGTASEALLLDAIDRWHFFDPITLGLTTEASSFVQRVALKAWEQATPSDREYLSTLPSKGVSVEGWFETRWHLGEWLADDRKERSIDLFGAHKSLCWLVPMYIKSGWEERGDCV